MFSTKKLLFFIVGIISVVSLFACQKASANQSNVSDTEETQKTVLEMEMNANYSNSDPFENGRLFCVSEDIETLDAEVYFQMDGERGIVEIKDRNADEVLWCNTWDEDVYKRQHMGSIPAFPCVFCSPACVGNDSLADRCRNQAVLGRYIIKTI